jgi:hypothetical protein
MNQKTPLPQRGLMPRLIASFLTQTARVAATASPKRATNVWAPTMANYIITPPRGVEAPLYRWGN